MVRFKATGSLTKKVAIGAIAVVILVAIGLFIWKLLPVRIESKAEPVVETITYSVDSPSETPPPADFSWKGSSNDPQYIDMPSVGIKGYLQRVGVDQDKQIAVPNNIHFAGWFVDSVAPGDEGLSIIDGHVDGPTQNAIFVQLPDVKIGDEFTVKMGDNTVRTFKVFATQSVELEQAASALFSQSPGVSKQLNLITCIGTYKTDIGQYDKRFIVSSERI
jgi:sortase A